MSCQTGLSGAANGSTTFTHVVLGRAALQFTRLTSRNPGVPRGIVKVSSI